MLRGREAWGRGRSLVLMIPPSGWSNVQNCKTAPDCHLRCRDLPTTFRLLEVSCGSRHWASGLDSLNLRPRAGPMLGVEDLKGGILHHASHFLVLGSVFIGQDYILRRELDHFIFRFHFLKDAFLMTPDKAKQCGALWTSYLDSFRMQWEFFCELGPDCGQGRKM